MNATETLWNKYSMPDNIRKHSEVVAKVALWLGRKLAEKGEKIDLELVECGALLHDIAKNESIRTGVRHGPRGKEILLAEGESKELAEIVEKHALGRILDPIDGLKTWEEKLVYYADKRVTHDKIVSLRERYDYLKKRYPQGTKDIEASEPLVFGLEKEIFDKIGEAPEAVLALN